MQKPIGTDEKDQISAAAQPAEQEVVVTVGSSDPYIGKVVGQRYEIEKLIGRGGMGSVYKVMHRQLKKPMAMKILPQGNGLDRVDIARFDAEAKAASTLHHPNLAGIHDYGTYDDGSPYIIMDYIEGESLSEMIKRDGPLKEEDALEIFLQVCNGLEFAHSKRLVHRDIKPSNIMVSKESGKLIARIVDFGIAKKLPAADEHNPTLTSTGEIVGSPQYMSPEQCMGYKLDMRSDIYSFGCVMFEALTGKPPFSAENAVQVIFKHVNERAPLFKAVNPNCKPVSGVERIVHQALEKEPDNRYQNVSDLKRDLELVKDGKNPVKEVSRMRNNLRTLGRVAKMCGWATLCVALTLTGVWFAWKSIMPSTPWGKIAAQAQADLEHFNYDDAEGGYLEALKLADDLKAPPGDKEQILFELACMYTQDGRDQKALETLQRAIALSNSHGVDVRRGTLYDESAQAYLDLHDYKKAEEMARKAIEIKEATVGTNNFLTGHSVSRLSQALRNQKRLSEAEEQARKYVSIEETLHPNEDEQEVAHAYESLTNILADESAVDGNPNKICEVIKAANKTLQLRIQILGSDHPKTRSFGRWFVDYLKYWHHDAEAAAIAKKVNIPLVAPADPPK